MQVSRGIRAAPDRVWRIITDLPRFPDVLSSVDRVERLDDGAGFDVGTSWRETRTVFGREATERMTVTALDAGRSYATRTESGRTHYTSVLRVEPQAPDGTTLAMSFAATSSGPVARLLGATVGRLLLGSTRRMLQQDLDDIAAAAERAAP